jgi:hypothetical protein
MKKYIVTHWIVSHVTFRKSHLIQTIVDAYDVDHARLKIDRHPDVIQSIKLMPENYFQTSDEPVKKFIN